jgi:hypothetical protein
MTLTKLKQLNQKNGGAFFSRATMKTFGDTMRGFSIATLPSGDIEVTRKNRSGRWVFDPKTGRVIDC